MINNFAILFFILSLHSNIIIMSGIVKLFNIKAICDKIFADKDDNGKNIANPISREKYPNFYIRITEFFNGSTRKANKDMLKLFHKQAKADWKEFDKEITAAIKAASDK